MSPGGSVEIRPCQAGTSLAVSEGGCFTGSYRILSSATEAVGLSCGFPGEYTVIHNTIISKAKLFGICTGFDRTLLWCD